jgi:hypothetical protein
VRSLRTEPALAYFALNADEDSFVAMNWEALSVLGIRRSWPFFNREVLELAFECHPSELIGPGVKKLLRAALSDDVPPTNLNRQTRGTWPPGSESLPTPTIGKLFEETFDVAELCQKKGEEEPWDVFWGWTFAGFERALEKLEDQRALDARSIC